MRLYRLGEKPAHIARRLGIGNASIVRRWDALTCVKISDTFA